MAKILSRCLKHQIRRTLGMKSNNLKLTLFTNITAISYFVWKQNPHTLVYLICNMFIYSGQEPINFS